MLHCLELVPHYLFLWLMQAITKKWGEEWDDAFQQGGWHLNVCGMHISTEWLNGESSADIHNNTFGIWAENHNGYRTFALSQYIIW